MGQAAKLIKYYCSYVVVFMLTKPLFMLCHRGLMGDCTLTDWVNVIGHGLPLDLSVAGYLTVVPGLLLIAALWTRRPWPRLVLQVYNYIVNWTLFFIFVLNIVLYSYWRFPLDSTPIFYFLSSPKDTLASFEWWQLGSLCVILVLMVASLVYIIRKKHYGKTSQSLLPVRQRVGQSAIVTLLLALLFIPIRGGVTVSTMNTGRVYFSERQELNHAAVNPVFSLMESLTHQENFASQYRFMDDAKAHAVFKTLVNTRSDSSQVIVSNRRPDVYIIILESFSQLVMQTQATPCLNRLAAEGVTFRNFFANSYRTDRGLVAILAGQPLPPSLSLMKYPAKTRHLPSIARSLTTAGYGTEYYYGGDADFCNQRSFLVSQGYQTIVEDKDFPVKFRLSKWGVPDGPLFDEAARRVVADDSGRPMLRVIQTSSSHEPFDVPDKILQDKRLNAFAYTDKCVGNFLRNLQQSNRWHRSLVVLVADHQGAWPDNVQPLSLRRFEIPLIITGGAIEQPMTVDTYGSQQDIAATLLGQLGIGHDDFLFSKDLLDPTVDHFAFFAIPDAFGMATADNRLIFDNKRRVAAVNEEKKNANLLQGKAYLQCLMDYIDGL